MNRKIKLAYCIPGLYASGGMERVLTLKANYLAEKLGEHIDMISCGANLYDVHTPHEKADVESFYRMEEVIIAILQEIAKA